MRRYTTIFFGALLVRFITSASAQGTTTIRFNGLPPGEKLGEQFALNGIHFVTNRNVPFSLPASVVAIPPTLSGSENVAVAVDLSMHFDSPVTGLLAKIAEFPTGQANYTVTGRDEQGVGIPGYFGDGGEFPAAQWYTASVSFSPEWKVTYIDLVGWDFTSGENFRSGFYIDSLEFTTIPEPQTLCFFTIGLTAMIAFRPLLKRPKPTRA